MTQSTSPIVLNGSQAISYGWTSVKKDFWYFVGMAIVIAIAGSIGSWEKGTSGWDLIGFLVSILITCGQTTLLLSYIDGKKLPLENIFTQTKKYFRVMVASMVLGLIVSVGMLLFIVPGVYFGLKYMMVINLIIDKNLSLGAAFQESARITQNQKLSLLGFSFMCLVVIILGALCLGVGVFVALPVVAIAQIVIYRQLASLPMVSPKAA